MKHVDISVKFHIHALPFYTFNPHTRVLLLKTVKKITTLFLTHFSPTIIQDKYPLWDFYTFAACLLSQTTLKKNR